MKPTKKVTGKHNNFRRLAVILVVLNFSGFFLSTSFIPKDVWLFDQFTRVSCFISKIDKMLQI